MTNQIICLTEDFLYTVLGFSLFRLSSDRSKLREIWIQIYLVTTCI